MPTKKSYIIRKKIWSWELHFCQVCMGFYWKPGIKGLNLSAKKQNESWVLFIKGEVLKTVGISGFGLLHQGKLQTLL